MKKKLKVIPPYKIVVVRICILNFLTHWPPPPGWADVNTRHLYEWYQLQLKVLDYSEVASYKPSLQCLWNWNCFHLRMPMLVQNLLECAEGDTYAKFIPLLGWIHVVDRPFYFFDIESRCSIKYKLEGHRAFLEACVLPQVDPNFRSKKYMRVIDLDFVTRAYWGCHVWFLLWCGGEYYTSCS